VFRVKGLGFRVVFRVENLGFRIQSPGFKF
jgi:hypothetical protein